MEENNTCVYMHVKKTNKEAFYIGIGGTKRPYYKGKGRSKLWRNVANKHGYEVFILAENLYWSDACKIEIDLIKYFGRRDLGTGHLVNLTDGGEGTKGAIKSAETRAKIGAGNKGKTISEETKANMSAAGKGKQRNVKLTEDQVIEVLAELRENTYWGQNVDLGKKYGVNRRTISDIKKNKKWKHICRETLTIIE